MKEFAYVRAGSVEEATSAYASHTGARYLGGGTNLVDLMKLGVEAPTALIDVTRLPLATVEELPGGALRVGAMVRNSDLAAHPLVRDRYPALSQAVLAGASGQLRNAATTGGNLLQRTRCPYFQDLSKPCNKREPGSGCGARDGVHRDHAVLGHSAHCIATHPSDMAVALSALDGRVELVGPEGARSVAAADFHRLPGDRPEQDTEIRPGELVTAVVLPAAAAGLPSAYRKARDRASYAFALASVAVVLRLENGVVGHVGLAFGALAHRPWRAQRAEEALLGAAPTRAAFEHAVDLELAAAQPLRDNTYKVPLARNLAVDVLSRLTDTELPGRAS
ncbi:FAD binding domain-containing protein [Streptomyces collinus]|uniref:Xanthine dehydrogenase YagS FAD-binding subunit n=1 Tax=Streptomyces collinus TaxID=42684 RepID=A0AA89QR46_STRCU|nr:xanthine dehydrogenase family protein subunit M [Streptomyces collinus]MBB5815944.1 xanthine dehydrogenase YagS FAD-binding subunit [Streptomyces collinus]WMX68817.1 xanthine dehydrogenase family protein subunit M [Streptomyces collinus]